jgi:type IV secretion system protein VirB10
MMLLLGGTTLAWYYGRQFSRQSHLRQSRQVAASAEVGTELALPSLGDIFPTRAPQPSSAQPAHRPISTSTSRAPAALSGQPAGSFALPTMPVEPLAVSPVSTQGAAAAGPPRSPGATERRLQGDVYAAVPAEIPGTDVSAHVAPAPPSDPAQTVPNLLPAPGAAGVAQSGLLTTPDSIPVAARRLRDRSLLLSKGTFIDCTLETAIDSTLPGITSCVTAHDTFSADGRVVLLERGTRLFGETQGQVQQGSARVYVLWTEARTPTGVVVPLGSPGTDELGRAGLPGTVQRHFWQRFGAAILMSTIDGAVQAAVQASNRNSGTVIYNPGATQDVMTEVLKSTVAIPPTVVKRNGDRIEVLVAQDVDFAHVYVLRAAPAGD